MISLFPKENQQNIEFIELLNKIRSKYKVCASLLGITKSQKFKKTINEKENENDSKSSKKENNDDIENSFLSFISF